MKESRLEIRSTKVDADNFKPGTIKSNKVVYGSESGKIPLNIAAVFRVFLRPDEQLHNLALRLQCGQ